MIGKIARALCLNKNQHRRILDIIVRTHHTMLTGVDYDLMGKLCASSVAIKLGSLEEQAVPDHRKRGLS